MKHIFTNKLGLMFAAVLVFGLTREIIAEESHGEEYLISSPEQSSTTQAGLEEQYKSVLGLYAEGDMEGWSTDTYVDHGLHGHFGDRDISGNRSAGYYFNDLNSDGVSELFIAEEGYAEEYLANHNLSGSLIQDYSSGYIYEIYTSIDWNPVLLCRNDDLNCYSLCENGVIYELHLSDPNTGSLEYNFYTLSENGSDLTWLETIKRDRYDNGDEKWVYSSSNQPEKEIAAQEGRELRNLHGFLNPYFTPIEDYNSGKAEQKNGD